MNDGKFVIHSHQTEKSHFDLRIEIAGIFKTWAFTKGLSTDSATRRMGIHIEDQDLDLYDFEGIIDEEKYGSGSAFVWDRGTYSNLRMDLDNLDMEQSFSDGHLKMFFSGKKLKGGFTLIDAPYGRTKWLQIKEADDFVDKANDIMTRQPYSILHSDQ